MRIPRILLFVVVGIFFTVFFTVLFKSTYNMVYDSEKDKMIPKEQQHTHHFQAVNISKFVKQNEQVTVPVVSFDSEEPDDMDLLQIFEEATSGNSINHTDTNCTVPIVPNVVHWTWFRDPPSEFRFHNLISALSVLQTLQPKEIVLWHDTLPTGTLWSIFKEQAERYHCHFTSKRIVPPSTIFDNPVERPEHKSDIVRIKILAKLGVIYLDLDVVVLKAFDPLLCFEAVMGKERHNGLCGGIILAAPNSRFMRMWFKTYQYFDDSIWDESSVKMPMLLSRKYPELIHVEDTSMHRPSWVEVKQLYSKGSNYDWSSNYAIHLWYRKYDVEHTANSIRGLNSTVGRLFRLVYYGSPELMKTTEIETDIWYQIK